jgi:hypothetical protein
MKISIFGAFWAAGFFLTSNPVRAAGLLAPATSPSGSYFESCNGCAVKDNSNRHYMQLPQGKWHYRQHINQFWKVHRAIFGKQ